ncbi:hypothetical protein V8C44DRAFT_261264 [Trichoderma aethiopicum]
MAGSKLAASRWRWRWRCAIGSDQSKLAEPLDSGTRKRPPSASDLKTKHSREEKRRDGGDGCKKGCYKYEPWGQSRSTEEPGRGKPLASCLSNPPKSSRLHPKRANWCRRRPHSVEQDGCLAACLYEHEHALLHRRPCKCRPNAPQNRRVDTRLLSWQAVSCWRCCEPPLARTRHPANGVTGLSLAWWNSGRCTSWSSDGCCSTARGDSGSRDAAEAGKSSMRTIYAGHAGILLVPHVLQCLPCCRGPKAAALVIPLPSWPLSLSLSLSSLLSIIPVHWAATGVGDRCPSTPPDSDVACSPAPT